MYTQHCNGTAARSNRPKGPTNLPVYAHTPVPMWQWGTACKTGMIKMRKRAYSAGAYNHAHAREA